MLKGRAVAAPASIYKYVVLFHKIRNIWEHIYGPDSFEKCEEFLIRAGLEGSDTVMIHLYSPVKLRGKDFKIKGKIWERTNT